MVPDTFLTIPFKILALLRQIRLFFMVTTLLMKNLIYYLSCA